MACAATGALWPAGSGWAVQPNGQALGVQAQGFAGEVAIDHGQRRLDTARILATLIGDGVIGS